MEEGIRRIEEATQEATIAELLEAKIFIVGIIIEIGVIKAASF